MSKLTKREKVMLIGLVCFCLITAGVYFFILPALERYNGLEAKIAEEKIVRQQMQTGIGDKELLAQQTEKLNSEVESLSVQYYVRMTDSEIDQLVTGMLLKHKLKPQSMNIGSSELTALETYGNTSSEEKTMATEMLMSNVSVKASGAKKDLISLIDEVSSKKSIRIKNFNFSSEKKEGGNITINFEVLMYEKAVK
ncbi:MAG: hypothetical protein K0R90_1537 [Oscillospiraceae bacterium]|nr:hypothetical protein [Oscillospiraceae bacterium]